MNALEIVQQACDTLGYTRVSGLSNKREPLGRRLLGALNRAGEETAAAHAWQSLTKRCTFQTLRLDDAYDENLRGYRLEKLAPDFDGILGGVVRDFTAREIISAQDAQAEADERLLGASGARRTFSVLGGALVFSPDVPGNHAHEMEFLYRSKNWVRRDDGNGNVTYHDFFDKDGDEPLLNPQLLLRGLLWKYRFEMGMDYAENYRDYENFLAQCRDKDGAAPVLRAARPAVLPRRNLSGGIQ